MNKNFSRGLMRMIAKLKEWYIASNKQNPLIFKYVGISLLLMLLAPILINYILGLNTPFSILVVGEAKDWIGFYGNFFSSVITAFISFFILYKTINANKNENDKNRKKQEIENLIKHLSEVSSFLDFEQIGFNEQFVFDNDTCKTEIDKLKKLQNDISRKKYEIHFLFINYNSENSKQYLGKFEECINEANTKINELIDNYQNLIRNDSEQVRNKDIDFIKKTYSQLKTLNKNLGKELFEKGVQWVNFENTKYEKL